MDAAGHVPELTLAAAARRQGGTTRPLERAARTGATVRVRAGAYAESEEWHGVNPVNRHLALISAAQSAARGRIVFSHESAAAIWGIPLVGALPGIPHATTSPTSGRRTTAAVHWHRAPLRDQVCEVGRFLVTTPLRTLLDLTAARSFVSGVVALDHVLHDPARFSLTRDDLLDAIRDHRPFRNARRAAATAEFGNGLAGSPGESVSRVRMAEGGFPRPQLQKRFIGIDGREYFTDFYFPEADAIGESDGAVKYNDPGFLKGRTPAQAFRDEKRREDALRPLVSAFVRWEWDDAWQGRPLFARLRAAGVHPTGRR